MKKANESNQIDQVNNKKLENYVSAKSSHTRKSFIRQLNEEQTITFTGKTIK